MASENMTIVLRWFDEVWNQRRSETIEELMTEESVCYADQGMMRGPVGFREIQYEPLLNAFPDLRVSIEDVVEEGENIVVRWSATGTHTGEGLPIPPTNKKATFAGMSWIRVVNGKLREGWQASNITDGIRALAEPSPVTM